jgi:hypothetical protein
MKVSAQAYQQGVDGWQEKTKLELGRTWTDVMTKTWLLKVQLTNKSDWHNENFFNNKIYSV